MPIRATGVPVPAAGKTAAMAVGPQPVTVLMRGVPGAAGALAVVVRPVAVVMVVATITVAPRAKGPAVTRFV
jgi:hypothetical protein